MEMTENKIQEEVYRFLQDLEFVQCLCNPMYLECKILHISIKFWRSMDILRNMLL